MTDGERILDGERRLAAAHLTLDMSEFEALLHEDFALLQPDGSLVTKRDMLVSLAAGSRSWSYARVDQLEVRVYGDCGRVVGRWSARGINNGAAFDYSAQFISTWVRREPLWQNLSYTSAEIIGA